MKRLGVIVLILALVCSVFPTDCLAAGTGFTDVPADAWYYEDVQKAVTKGLINGKTATTYAPKDHLTYAETVKLAACMYKLSIEGNVDFEQSSPWYMAYVEYAEEEHIITKEYEWGQKTTRAEYLDIFSRALPAEELTEVNSVPDNAIPDVPMTHPFAASIYKMYRAGIVQGSDAQYNFKPSSNITRAEVAAILTRMMDTSARKIFTITIPEYRTLYNTGYAPYDAKINEYCQAMNADDNSFDRGSDCSSINGLMVWYAREYYAYGEPGRLYYSLYDVDKNGVPELIFSNGASFIDIYTLNNGGLVKIFKDCYFGERSRLHVLYDGTLLTEGSSGAFTSSCETFHLNSDGSLKSTGAYYFNANGPDAYMKGYTYISSNEYFEKVNNLMSYSLFNSLDWKLFADMEEIIQKRHYNTASIALRNGNYLYAAEQFLEAGDYQDASTMVLECYYRYGKAQMKLNYITNGLEYLSKCRGYKDTDEIVLGYYYDEAMLSYKSFLDALTAGDSWNGDKYYEDAIEKLGKCENYKDSQDVLVAMKKIDEAVSVLFGNVRTSVDEHMAGSDISLKDGILTFDIPMFVRYFTDGSPLHLEYDMSASDFTATLGNMNTNESVASAKNAKMVVSLLTIFTGLENLDDFVALYSNENKWNATWKNNSPGYMKSGSTAQFLTSYGGYVISIEIHSSNNRLSWNIIARK